MNKTMNDLFAKLEELGWSYYDNGNNEYTISKFSPARQDFNVNITGEDIETFIADLDDVHDNFDVSQEAYYWLDNSGHGKNGAPYLMKDVLADMEACEEMLSKLLKELRSHFNVL